VPVAAKGMDGLRRAAQARRKMLNTLVRSANIRQAFPYLVSSSGGPGAMRRMSGRLAVLFRLPAFRIFTSAAVVAVCCRTAPADEAASPAPASQTVPPAATDPWSSGMSLPEWQKITAIQRYPAFGPEPEWKPLSGDASELVRTAAVLAIGRTGEARLLPYSVAALEDASELVRHNALWAVLQVESDDIKAPVLKVLGSWEARPGSGVGALEEGYTLLLGRAGLPYDVGNWSLEKRRQWLKTFDAEKWRVAFLDWNDSLSRGDGVSRCGISLEESEFDAGAVVRGRLVVERRGGSARQALPGWGFHDGPGRLLDYRGPRAERSESRWSVEFPGHEAGGPSAPGAQVAPEFDPNKKAERDVLIRTDGEGDAAGVYLINPFGVAGPLLVRIRRSAEFEARIPELLKNVEDPATIRKLGRQRVRAAVPAMMEVFRKHGQPQPRPEGGPPRRPDNPINFDVAEALARIGDPRAVPVLLDYPSLRDDDMLGSTAPFLRAFGGRAYGEYEARIVRWSEELDAGRYRSLCTSLELLGAEGSEAALRTAAEIRRKAVAGELPEGMRKTGAEVQLFVATLPAALAGPPRETAELIWSLRDRDDFLPQVTVRLHEMKSEVRLEIVKDLVRRAKAAPGDGGEMMTRVLRISELDLAERVTMEELVPAELGDILVQREAELVLDEALWSGANRERAAERVEKYLARRPIAPMEVRLGILHVRMGRPELGERLLKGAVFRLASEHDRGLAVYFLGEIHEATNRRAEARKAYQEALDIIEELSKKAGTAAEFVVARGQSVQRGDIERKLAGLEGPKAPPGGGTETAQPPAPPTPPPKPRPELTEEQKELMKASWEGNLAVLREILDGHPEWVNQKDSSGDTPLSKAVAHGRKEVAALLIERGADINSRNDYGTAVLHVTPQPDPCGIFELLIAHGAKIDIWFAAGRGRVEDVRKILAESPEAAKAVLPNDGVSVLNIAAGAGHKEVVEMLLAHGADVNAGGRFKVTPLASAAFKGYTEVAAVLLAHGADPRCVDSSNPPLMLATLASRLEMVRLLLDRGARPQDCSSTILQGVRTRQIAELLIDHGLDVNEPIRGVPPLLWTVGGTSEVAELLVERGADVNAADYEGRTGLHAAAEHNNARLIKFLLGEGAKIEARTRGETALHRLLAANRAGKETVELLLDHGLDVNDPEATGRTPLHLAARRGWKHIVEVLVARGAGVNARNQYGETPLHEAATLGHLEAVRALLAAGADAAARDHEGQTASQRAAQKGHAQVAEALGAPPAGQ